MAHRIPSWYVRPPDPRWAERVEREATTQTDQRQRRHDAAARRLERAEARLVRAEQENTRKSDLSKLRAEVERRREELLDLQREMNASPAGAQHRGRGAHRGVPGTRPL